MLVSIRSVLPLFRVAAQELLDSSGLTAVDVIAKALAKISVSMGHDCSFRLDECSYWFGDWSSHLSLIRDTLMSRGDPCLHLRTTQQPFIFKRDRRYILRRMFLYFVVHKVVQSVIILYIFMLPQWWSVWCDNFFVNIFAITIFSCLRTGCCWVNALRSVWIFQICLQLP